VQTPIACTLSSQDATERIEEWRRFFSRSVDQVESLAADRVRFRLQDGPEAVSTAADLARREKACCGFFEFSIEVQVDSCWLVVGVPEEAASVLTNFALFAGPTG
jgi:hypothetical protein